jgi:hypothetical protein
VFAVLRRIISGRRALRPGLAIAGMSLLVPGALGQDLNSLPASSREQWKVFVNETLSPLFFGAAFFNASVSQASLSTPHYGPGAGPYGERFASQLADIGTQDFFGDYVMASLFHEDTRYRRKGPGYGFWVRVGHAASSGLVTRTFSGSRTVNWSNIAGTAISVGLSNTYYPVEDRTWRVTGINFGTSVVGAGLGNLAPEFWPDFHQFLIRHHLAPGGP